MDINDKVAVITGGLGGIGFLTVKYLLTNGAKYVAILDVRESHSDVVINSIKELETEFGKGKFALYSCDVTNVHNFTNCFKDVMQQQNHVDILINCAGILNEQNVDLSIDINFKATVNCTLIAIDHMGKHKGGKGGVVVNIASITGLMNDVPLIPIYAATKHAIVSFVRSLGKHNEKLGVRVVCICPHLTDTSMLNSLSNKNCFLDFCEGVFEASVGMFKQKPETVASAIIEIIKKGKPGAVWVSEKDEPPYAVRQDTDVEKLREEI